MEGRAPQARSRNPAAPGTASGGRGRGIWIIAGVILAIAAIAGLLAFALQGNDDTLDAYSQAPDTITSLPADEAGSPDGSAMIVDAGGGAVTPDPALPGDAGTPADADAAPGTAAADTAPQATAASVKPHAQRRQAPPAKAKAKTSEDDLLGTLLGIIKEDKKDAPKHESMDSLIAKIQAEDQRNAADTDAAFDSIDRTKGKSSASTHSEIQTQLRRCPQANTLEGIECRRKICAAHTGKDPACPAQ